MSKDLKREILITEDGSTTIHLPEWNESYHSKHGAIQEAEHVFIKNGLSQLNKDNVSILEIGFGTGLNAFITYLEGKKRNLIIDYVGVEAYPIDDKEVLLMNYPAQMGVESETLAFEKMHQCIWNEKYQISDSFSLTKRKQFFDQIDDVEKFDLIYFDAFGYRVQPELWSAEIFKKMYNSLKGGGILVTYAARGVITRNMQEAGFKVEKLQGPPGKREMTRGFKTPE